MAANPHIISRMCIYIYFLTGCNKYSHATKLQSCQSSMGREKAGFQRTPQGTIRGSTNRDQHSFVQNLEVHWLIPPHLPTRGNFVIASRILAKNISNDFMLDHEICLNTCVKHYGNAEICMILFFCWQPVLWNPYVQKEVYHLRCH